MKNIFLIGMPSSGKSTLGRKLARALNYRFVDLDKLIVKEQKQSIPDIFSEKGEGYFREVESRILKETRPNQWLVVATGGGAPCFFDNMEFIKSNGLSIFLSVSPKELARRILNHGEDDRPLLSGVTELEKELNGRLENRNEYYSQADIIIDESACSIPGILKTITPLI
jgi:shikimate kinase